MLEAGPEGVPGVTVVALGVEITTSARYVAAYEKMPTSAAMVSAHTKRAPQCAPAGRNRMVPWIVSMSGFGPPVG